MSPSTIAVRTFRTIAQQMIRPLDALAEVIGDWFGRSDLAEMKKSAREIAVNPRLAPPSPDFGWDLFILTPGNQQRFLKEVVSLARVANDPSHFANAVLAPVFRGTLRLNEHLSAATRTAIEKDLPQSVLKALAANPDFVFQVSASSDNSYLHPVTVPQADVFKLMDHLADQDTGTNKNYAKTDVFNAQRRVSVEQDAMNIPASCFDALLAQPGFVSTTQMAAVVADIAERTRVFTDKSAARFVSALNLVAFDPDRFAYESDLLLRIVEAAQKNLMGVASINVAGGESTSALERLAAVASVNLLEQVMKAGLDNGLSDTVLESVATRRGVVEVAAAADSAIRRLLGDATADLNSHTRGALAIYVAEYPVPPQTATPHDVATSIEPLL